ncbi:Hypothetical predicted protein [Olea europaea subsp. europaea]|uniref:Uncharacterized protein n=1 Tax=Olea europaea subsp. europaea TaxID=158383 RepID=A0A8S0TVB8_OLEEU|nr:Hypothetical predicted protein [Olea europaea subsp. europaea]
MLRIELRTILCNHNVEAKYGYASAKFLHRKGTEKDTSNWLQLEVEIFLNAKCNMFFMELSNIGEIGLSFKFLPPLKARKISFPRDILWKMMSLCHNCLYVIVMIINFY